MAHFFITGATGTVGTPTVKALWKLGHRVTAATRYPERANENLPAGVGTRHFDYTDPTTFDSALTADAIFLLGPPLETGLFAMLEPLVDRLVEAGFKGRLVYLSAYGMESLEELPFHGQMERKLQASGLDWNIVRPGFFADNFGNYERENIEERNLLFSPAGLGAAPFVSATDIGESVAVLLTDPTRTHETHVLTGPKAYTYPEVAELLTEITGRKIEYGNPDAITYRQVLASSGAPDFVADYMLPVYGLIAEGKVSATADGVRQLTGHAPRSLRSVLEHDFSPVAAG